MKNVYRVKGGIMKPLVVKNQKEADWLNRNVLHCGWVHPGDLWDTPEAWPDPDDRELARAVLLRYRKEGSHAIVWESERWQLAVCCREG